MVRDCDGASAPRAKPGRRDVSLPEIRRAARRAVELRSTRKVAKEIGISAAGLRYFLKGGVPYERTLRLLIEWCADHGESLGMSREALAPIVLAAFLDLFPVEHREEVRACIVNFVRDRCAEDGCIPSWACDRGDQVLEERENST